jgi:hypothetical protein
MHPVVTAGLAPSSPPPPRVSVIRLRDFSDTDNRLASIVLRRFHELRPLSSTDDVIVHQPGEVPTRWSRTDLAAHFLENDLASLANEVRTFDVPPRHVLVALIGEEVRLRALEVEPPTPAFVTELVSASANRPAVFR